MTADTDSKVIMGSVYYPDPDILDKGGPGPGLGKVNIVSGWNFKQVMELSYDQSISDKPCVQS